MPNTSTAKWRSKFDIQFGDFQESITEFPAEENQHNNEEDQDEPKISLASWNSKADIQFGDFQEEITELPAEEHEQGDGKDQDQNDGDGNDNEQDNTITTAELKPKKKRRRPKKKSRARVAADEIQACKSPYVEDEDTDTDNGYVMSTLPDGTRSNGTLAEELPGEFTKDMKAMSREERQRELEEMTELVLDVSKWLYKK